MYDGVRAGIITDQTRIILILREGLKRGIPYLPYYSAVR